MEKRVVAIVGPTASGKTKLGIELAIKLNSEIISADSRQVFKELTIGTAKPDINELMKVKHHFIHHISINEKYDVGKFVQEASEVIRNLHNQNKIPVVVGGSGLYINSLLYGIFEGPPADDLIRKNLELELQNSGIQSLLNKLKKIDPETFDRIDKNNPRRIIRALEVYYLTGFPISVLQKVKHKKPDYEILIFGLNWERKLLYERINNRVEQMIQMGLIEEVKEVISKFGENINTVLQTVGYKETIQFLKNEIDYSEMVELIKRNTRRYAKRQLTWFRKNKDIHWFNLQSEKDFVQIVNQITQLIYRGQQ